MKKASSHRRAIAKGRKSPKKTPITDVMVEEQIADSQHPHGILSLIKEHHDEMRPDIEVLKSEKASIAEKRQALKHFLPRLKVHAHAEQNVLYDACEEIKPLKQATSEGFIEHETAERLLREIEVSGFEARWDEGIAAKAKVLVELVEHHMREEENTFFAKVRGSFTREELAILADAYLMEYEAEWTLNENFGVRLPSFDDIRETLNNSWRQAYSQLSERLYGYVRNR